MLIVVSPAKTMDYESRIAARKFTQPEFLEDARLLNERLRELDCQQLRELHHISDDLAQLNHGRNKAWKLPFDRKNARPAIFAFKGDVYLGIQVEDYDGYDLNFAQKHLRILSGLYGLLKPLDLMQPYRLEMGTALKSARGNNLYDFWGSKLADKINREFAEQDHKVLINLASNEYFSALKARHLDAEIITPVFKDYASGEYRVLSFFAKKARGMMVSYIVKNRIKSPRKLRDFSVDGYRYCNEESTGNRLVFLRKQSGSS